MNGMLHMATFGIGNVGLIAGSLLALAGILIMAIFSVYYGLPWIQAYMTGADVRMLSMIRMTLRGIDPRMIVTAKVMGSQAGLNIDRESGMSTSRLEAHFLSGGDVRQVLRAVIAAHAAQIDLDFERAAAIDLAGRDVLDAVRTSVSPRVIYCPISQTNGPTTLSAVARNGVELRVRALVTYRTNLNGLIGGATEETIVARVGQGILAVIGAATTHMDVLAMPGRISKNVLECGLDANTAYEIISIDIADIDVGDNIGARLQSDQADADTRVAIAHAEPRYAAALAKQQEMQAQIATMNAALVLADSQVPAALAEAFRQGQFHAVTPAATTTTPPLRTPSAANLSATLAVFEPPRFSLTVPKKIISPPSTPI